MTKINDIISRVRPDGNDSEKRFFWDFLGRFGFTIFQIVFLFLFIFQLLVSVLMLQELKQMRQDNARAVRRAFSLTL